MIKRLLPMLLALLLPACRGTGAEGLPPATLLDIEQIVRPGSPNTALAAPTGFHLVADIVTPRFTVSPDQLYAAIRSAALAQPRTTLHAAFDSQRQLHFVARSAILNFPDLITVQVTAESDLVLWSRSVYGSSDFGANRARLGAWLGALPGALGAP